MLFRSALRDTARLASRAAAARPAAVARPCTVCQLARPRPLRPQQYRLRPASLRVVRHSSTTGATAKQCPHCSAPAESFATQCPSCSSPLPIPGHVSYYDLFPSLRGRQPPAGPFALDARALRREVLQLQQRVHPDRFAGGLEGDAERRRVAENVSASLNTAYATLRDPLARAEYLLTTAGHGVKEEGEKVMDPSTLMEVMEAREAVEESEAATAEQVANDAALQDLLATYSQRAEDEEQALEAAFAKGDYPTAKQAAIRLKYWLSIKRAISDKAE